MLVGIGNVDREDDGVGQLVVQRLSQRHPSWPVLLVRQLLPELVDQVANAPVLIFVDAATDLPPGDVQVSQLASTTSDVSPGLGSHLLHPEPFMALLRLVAATDREPCKAWCVRIGIERLGFGQTLSAPVALAVARGVEQVESLWGRWSAAEVDQ